ncbi:MAG: TAXI family TRAP transporter solute-binding subunit [Gammaproteobacteria bacterium]|nr:TAXI family TRAP transporter solute-binding subunit [Gammaproteobacteria bacterium]
MPALTLAVALGVASASHAFETAHTLFRIGTAGQQGTYYPIGTLIADAISGGSPPCPPSGECGVPGLLAVAQLSNGSVSNVKAITAGAIEAGLVQADVAYWAYTGTEIFADQGNHPELRAVASLYPESVHLVTRSGSALRSVAALAGRRVSLDEPGSGTLVDARLVLDAYGLAESQLKPVYLKPQFAAELLVEGKLDAFFIVGGYPAKSVLRLAAGTGAGLIPIDGAPARRATQMNPFFAPGSIPAGTYPRIPETSTLQVGAQLLVNAKLDEGLVYRITKSLWSTRTLQRLSEGHPKGDAIRLQNAVSGVAVPLHPGAARFYREAGVLPATSEPAE